MERCQYELATEKYFGLQGTVNERDKIDVDYGLLVDFAHAMKNDWIKVSDKEPPKAEPILIFNGHWIGVGYYKKNFALNIDGEPDWCDETTEYIEPGATHWMPLPDRPIVSDGSNVEALQKCRYWQHFRCVRGWHNKILKMKNEFFVIGLDFDGTVVKHKFPDIGEEVPYCLDVLKALQSAGHKIVLNTMRSDRPEGAFLTDAVNFLTERGIELWGINENPKTTSPKVYAHLYIDDAALGVPLKQDAEDERPFVDWKAVGEMLLGHGYVVEQIVLP